MARAKGRLIFEARTIPHEEQRYPTVGDWDEQGRILVSDLGNWKWEFLVAVHEAIEAALCRARGISETAVSNWDIDREKERKPGDRREVGDMPGCPYRRQHQIATSIEYLICTELRANWSEYGKALDALHHPMDAEQPEPEQPKDDEKPKDEDEKPKSESDGEQDEQTE